MNEVSPELLRIMQNGDNSIEYKCKKIIPLIRTISDQPATIIQNANQINFLLCGVPKALPQEPARRAKIGFDVEA